MKNLLRKIWVWMTTYKRCWGKSVREVFPYRLNNLKVQDYRFSVLAEKVIVVLAAFGLAIGILYGTFQAGRLTAESKITYAKQEIEVEVDKSNELFTKKIDSLKDEVINKLMLCEAPGYKDTDVMVTFDPLESNPTGTKLSHIPSYGPLQFKESTVIHYYKLQNGKTLTPKEAVSLALDSKSAKELAKFVIFETKGKVTGDWKHCGEKLNLDSQVDLIKKLEL